MKKENAHQKFISQQKDLCKRCLNWVEKKEKGRALPYAREASTENRKPNGQPNKQQ